MAPFNNVLAVVQDKSEAAQVLAKAKALTQAPKAGAVHVVRVVYEGIADLNSKQIEGSTELNRRQGSRLPAP